MLFKKIKRYWMHIWKASRKKFEEKYYICKEKEYKLWMYLPWLLFHCVYVSIGIK